MVANMAADVHALTTTDVSAISPPSHTSRSDQAWEYKKARATFSTRRRELASSCIWEVPGGGCIRLNTYAGLNGTGTGVAFGFTTLFLNATGRRTA